MSFDPGLKRRDTLNNKELRGIFKCSPQGGMRRSIKTNSLVLTTSPYKLYNDRWDNDILHYTGMGLTGDQDLNYSQNKTLAQSNSNGVNIFLFEVLIPKEYTYVGQVQLIGTPYQEEQIDQNDSLRNVWIFPLKLKDNTEPLEIQKPLFDDIKDKREKHVKKLSNEGLNKHAKSSNKNAGSRTVVTQQYERDPYVSEYAKRRANGLCQLCEMSAPFNKKNGEPYLETHHIIWLSEGGKDSIDNTVALCPNCHRKMHALNLKSDQEILKNKAKISL